MSRKIAKASQEILSFFLWEGKALRNLIVNPYDSLIYMGYDKPDFCKRMYNLERGGFIKKQRNTSKEKVYSLTKKGRHALTGSLLEQNKKRKKWNKKWYVLIFDVPEKKRKYREGLIRTLKNIGFYQLQKSVWVFPYDVLNYLYEVLPGFREGDWFEYMEITKISSQDKLKDYFGLE